MKADLAIDSKDKIGEGPVWDEARSRLLWSDNESGIIHEAKKEASGSWRESHRWSFGRPIAAAVPRSRGGLAVVSGNGVFFMDDSGKSEPFASLGFDLSRFRFGDAKCDPFGRLWVNTFAHNFGPHGCVFRIDSNGDVLPMLDSEQLSNGMDWSPDAATFYFADSAKRTVDAFDCRGNRDGLRNRRTIVSIERGGGAPNGIAVDREGCLWIALTGGGEVRRYTPDGRMTARVDISGPGATSCAFGGEDCGELFITSRSGRLPDIAISIGVRPEMMQCDGPGGGGLFVCRPGVKGSAATPFAG